MQGGRSATKRVYMIRIDAGKHKAAIVKNAVSNFCHRLALEMYRNFIGKKYKYYENSSNILLNTSWLQCGIYVSARLLS